MAGHSVGRARYVSATLATRATLATLAAVTGLAGCTAFSSPPTDASSSPTPVVHISTPEPPPTVDAEGVPIVPLPTDLPDVPMTGTRVRGLSYGYAIPQGWSQVQPTARPAPDTMIAPGDGQMFIAVDHPFGVGSRTVTEVVAQLRKDFAGRGSVRAALPRDIAGFESSGMVLDPNPDVRHVYYIAVYAERVYAVRATYAPDSEREALAALKAVLDTWTWG